MSHTCTSSDVFSGPGCLEQKPDGRHASASPQSQQPPPEENIQSAARHSGMQWREWVRRECAKRCQGVTCGLLAYGRMSEGERTSKIWCSGMHLHAHACVGWNAHSRGQYGLSGQNTHGRLRSWGPFRMYGSDRQCRRLSKPCHRHLCHTRSFHPSQMQRGAPASCHSTEARQTAPTCALAGIVWHARPSCLRN